MKFYPKRDTTFITSSLIENQIAKSRKEENAKRKLKQEKDGMNKYYEKELNHYKRQKEIFLNNLNNAKTDSEKYRFSKLLKYNEINMEKTLLSIKQRDNVK